MEKKKCPHYNHGILSRGYIIVVYVNNVSKLRISNINNKIKENTLKQKQKRPKKNIITGRNNCRRRQRS